ncbi:MAG TPA: alpha-L-arabinofuranosidase C-terminal domain-containing protein [Fimbriimonadaceae bacterium]|jgi:alpha-L-arabinofuranosidase
MLTAILALLTLTSAPFQSGTIVVNVDRPGPNIRPTFFGLMTEEINHAYDGGLYAELIRNRALKDDPAVPAHWSLVNDSGSGSITLADDAVPGTKLSKCLKLGIDKPGTRVGVANEGYWGIPVQPNEHLRASFYAKVSPGFSGPITLDIESPSGKVLASASVSSIGADWRKYSADLRTGDLQSSKDNRFVLSSNQPGTIWLTQVSLFPPSFKGRQNGNRIDLMKKLGAMHPSFLRLPGGNYLEGDTIADRFNWKATLGDISQRDGHKCPWGYRSTDGLGLLEYLEWCEDLHMQPVLAVYAGYSLRGEHVTGSELEPFVKDALDEIEYVTGGPNTTWGAVRAKDGHPKPFPLTYVEVGNEDYFDRSGSYDSRYAQFYDAIKARYPKLQLIATTPVKSRKPDVLDDHYYRSATAMERDSGHYDTYDRSGPKIFVGEWAVIDGRPTPNLRAALGDAAWLTGLERNSDVVVMESYAPLFVNVNPGAAQWPTNLIGYDDLNSFGSPTYWVQCLFAQNTGAAILSTKVDVKAAETKAAAFQGGIGLGTYRTHAEYKDLSVTNNGQTLYSKDFAAGSADWKMVRGTWSVGDGALRQDGNQTNARAVAGDPAWGNYTLEVKARKLSGAEGFMVLFHYTNDDHYWQWNVGGWNDSLTAFQHVDGQDAEEVGKSADVKVETGRWYDLKVEAKGDLIRGFIDGKLVSEAHEEAVPLAPVYAAASLTRSGDEVILKAVNVSDDAVRVNVSLEGVGAVEPVAQAWEITGNLEDHNSIDQPEKIVPRAFTIEGVSPSFEHSFPAHSITVMRVKIHR